MPINYIIGPSHIHSENTCQIENEIKDKTLFANCILDGYCGLPIWSKRIYDSIKENVNRNNNIYWIVSDYKLNNADYPKILDIQTRNELFLDTVGHSGNVSHNFLEKYHIEALGNHSFKVIDFMVSNFPNIKLIFGVYINEQK